VPVVDEGDLVRLLKTTEGRDFDERRDNAILRMLIDTGMRRGELVGLRPEDLDRDTQMAVVVGKGSRPAGALRREDGAGARPLPPRASSSRARLVAVALARSEGSHD
jgi:integrase